MIIKSKHTGNFTIFLLILSLIAILNPIKAELIDVSENRDISPSFDFDFSSFSNRKSAEDGVTSLRNSWGDFFSARPKPVFSDSLTNVVKGS